MSPELLDAARAYVQVAPPSVAGPEFDRVRAEVERLDAAAEHERVLAQIAEHEGAIRVAKERAASLAERAGRPKRTRRARQVAPTD